MGEPIRPPSGGQIAQAGNPSPQTVDLGFLDRLLADFFKDDSPWKVAIKPMGKSLYYVWQKYNKEKPIGNVIYLSPVDLANPAGIRQGIAKGDTPALLIPVQGSIPTAVYVDTRTDQIVGEKEGKQCPFPQYIVVPQKAGLIEDGDKIVHQNNIYKLGIVFVKPESPGYVTSEDGTPGIQLATDVRCYREIIEETKPEGTETAGTNPPPREEINGAFCALYDVSGSMGSLSENYIHDLMMRQIVPELTKNLGRFLLNYDVKKFYDKTGSNGLQKVLNNIFFSINIYLGNAEQTLFQTNLLSAADFINKGELESILSSPDFACYRYDKYLFDIDFAERPFEISKLLNEASLKAWLEKRFGSLKGNNPLFRGPDAVSYLRPNDNCKGDLFRVSDNHRGVLVRPASVITHYLIPLDGQEDLLFYAINNKLPLFLTIKLLDGNIRNSGQFSDIVKKALLAMQDTPAVLSAVNSKDTNETYLYHILPLLLKLPAEEQDRQLMRLQEIIESPNYDVHLKKRAIALMAVLALRGNSRPQAVLWNMLKSPKETIELDVRTYLAKSMSAIIKEEQAKELLKLIKSNPINPLNTIYLIAAAGRPQFLDAFKFMLDHVWSATLVKNEPNGNLLTVLAALFADPIGLFKYPKGTNQQTLSSLAGTPWSAEQLQEIFETLSGRILPVLVSEMQEVMSMMYGYSLSFLRPEWVKRDEVLLNPIPKERYYYNIPLKTALTQLGKIVKTAKWEDAWVHFKNGKSSAMFEIGLLQSSGSAVSVIDWDFIAANMPKKTEKSGDGVLETAHIHIHPWNDISVPMHMSTLPSGADFLSGWFSYIVKFRSRYPKGKCKFLIVSPLGVTVVRPKEKMLALADEIIELKGGVIKDEEGIIAPMKYRGVIKEYDDYIRRVLDLFDWHRIESILGNYYTIEFKQGGLWWVED